MLLGDGSLVYAIGQNDYFAEDSTEVISEEVSEGASEDASDDATAQFPGLGAAYVFRSETIEERAVLQDKMDITIGGVEGKDYASNQILVDAANEAEADPALEPANWNYQWQHDVVDSKYPWEAFLPETM